MPRASNGNYVQPGGTNAVSGQVISSVAHNTLTADYAAEITDSLDRSGKGGMLAALAMGGHPINGVSPGVLPNDAATVSQLGTVGRSVRAAALGGTDTASISDAVIYWNYSFSGTKHQSIPAAASAAAGQTLVIKDRLGDSAINPILITPLGGTIDDGASRPIQIARQSLTLIADPVSNNWMMT